MLMPSSLPARWIPAKSNRQVKEEAESGIVHDGVKFYEKTTFYESSKDLDFSIMHIGTESSTYVGSDGKLGPVFVSLNMKDNLAAILVRSPIGAEHFIVNLPKGRLFYGLLSKKTKLKSFLKEIGHPAASLRFEKYRIEPKLRMIDLKLSIVNYRIGVLLVKPDDKYEEDALANSHGSASFDRFVEFLGDRVELKNWPHYSGGLDVRNNLTGTHAPYYQTQGGKQVIFHVGPWIPSNVSDAEQIERKRFIGNDIINILFLEEGQGGFKLGSIRSKQTQCLVVAREKGLNLYGCNVFFKQGVKNDLEITKMEFNRNDRDRFNEFLISLEHRCYEAEAFKTKLIRTRLTMLNSIINEK